MLNFDTLMSFFNLRFVFHVSSTLIHMLYPNHVVSYES